MATERTVYVLDDDDAVLRSLERLLSSANFKPIIFDHPSVFLTAAKTFKTGCVLLDVRLPGMSGLEVQTQLMKMRNDLAVIVVTGQGDIQTAVRAMKAGAIDFLEKPYSDHALLGSIEVAFARENQHNRDHDIADAILRIATLSPREREVLDGLLAGRPNKLIAYDLGISVRTVEVHRARMMERLGMRQLAEVILLGVMARLNAPRHRLRPAIRQPCSGTVFQGAPVQNFHRSLACQSNDAAAQQIRNGTTHGLDRDGKIFGYVIARDGQFHPPPCFQRSLVATRISTRLLHGE